MQTIGIDVNANFQDNISAPAQAAVSIIDRLSASIVRLRQQLYSAGAAFGRFNAQAQSLSRVKINLPGAASASQAGGSGSATASLPDFSQLNEQVSQLTGTTAALGSGLTSLGGGATAASDGISALALGSAGATAALGNLGVRAATTANAGAVLTGALISAAGAGSSFANAASSAAGAGMSFADAASSAAGAGVSLAGAASSAAGALSGTAGAGANAASALTSTSGAAASTVSALASVNGVLAGLSSAAGALKSRFASFSLPSFSLPAHASGGIMRSPHVGLVAEDGPEAIIPLSSTRKRSALGLWQRVGNMLGVNRYADGGVTGRAFPPFSALSYDANGSSASPIRPVVNVSLGDIVLNFDSPAASPADTIAHQADALANSIAARIASSLSDAYGNMPFSHV